MGAILLMIGSESPWSGTQPGPIGTVERFRLEVRGQPLGTEERWQRPGARPWVRRWFRWEVRGRATDRLEDGVLGSGPWVAVLDPTATAPPIVDPGQVYAISVPNIAGARALRRLTLHTSLILPDLPPLQSYDDGSVVTQVPLPDEIPRDVRRRIDTAILAVRGDLPGGDCQDLSRALAARLGGEVAVGMAYFDEDREPAFYPHAWVLLREDGRVIPIDPSLGQVIADATHLYLGPDTADAAREFVATLAVNATLTVTPAPRGDSSAP